MALGSKVLADITRRAIERCLGHAHGLSALACQHLFTEREQRELADALAASIGTAELLGRSRIRQQLAKVLARHPVTEAVLPLPDRRQDTDYSCGAAALQSVLSYFGIDVSEAELARELGTTTQTGTTPDALIRVAKARGLEADGQGDLTLADLEMALDAGAPVLCAVQAYGEPGEAGRDEAGHYVVVIGYDAERLYLQDPVNGQVAVNRDTFERAWHDREEDGKRYVRYGIVLWRPGGPITEARAHLLEEIKPMPPERAVDYFSRLTPTLGIDPDRFGADLRRRAFTLAVATDKQILGSVQDYIRGKLQSGEGIANAPREIDAMLDAAGVSPRNPAYAEMVVRTNVKDAYNQAATEALQDPDVIETFPVWEYTNPEDSRSRPEHAERNGQYYPSDVPFAQVRGTDIADAANCRCIAPWIIATGRCQGLLQVWYSGEILDLVTRSGQCLTITPNHPVLTQQGFVRADALEQGINLLRYVGTEDSAALPHNEQYKPTSIQEMFRAAAEVGSPRGTKVVSALDFHTDGHSMKGNIHVVCIDSFLPSVLKPKLPEFASEQTVLRIDPPRANLAGQGMSQITRPDSPPAASGAHFGPLDSFGCLAVSQRNALLDQPSSHCSPVDTESTTNFVGRFPGNITSRNLRRIKLEQFAQSHSFRSGAELDIRCSQPTAHGCPFDAELPTKLFARFPGKVAFDQVVKIRRHHYSGPLYDMSTDVGYYIASTLLVHNCDQIPVDKWEWQKLKASGKRIADGYVDPAAGVTPDEVDTEPEAQSIPAPAQRDRPIETVAELDQALGGYARGDHLVSQLVKFFEPIENARAAHSRTSTAMAHLLNEEITLAEKLRRGDIGKKAHATAYADLEARMHEAKVVNDAARKAKRDAENQGKQDAFAALRAPSPTVVRLTPLAGARSLVNVQPANEAATWLGSVLDNGGLKRKRLPVRMAQTPTRAYADPATNSIHLTPNSNATVAVHELGHQIEFQSPGALKAALAFREKVVSGPTIQLNKLDPFFDAGEIAKEAKVSPAIFSERQRYYVGKDYGPKATEIISMGVEKLYTDPIGFAKHDPEYFKFITGILDGHLRVTK